MFGRVDAQPVVFSRWPPSADCGCAHRRCWIEEAHVTELTPVLRGDRAGDQLAGWPPRCASSPAASGPTPAPS
jgi:hypothetical protein